MNVNTLMRELLEQSDHNLDVKVAMWFGPGSPSAELFDVCEVRWVNGALWIGANDVTRLPKGRGANHAQLEAACLAQVTGERDSLLEKVRELEARAVLDFVRERGLRLACNHLADVIYDHFNPPGMPDKIYEAWDRATDLLG